MNKKFILTIITAISAVIFISAPVSAIDCVPAPEPTKCNTILPESWCKENGVWEILNLVLAIATTGVGILATIGIVVTGIQWLTARDKEDQIVKAKNRMLNIVIGLLVYGTMWLFMQWLIPGGILTGNLQDIKEIPHGIGGCPPGQMPDPSQPPPTTNPNNPNNSSPNPTIPGPTGPGQVSNHVMNDPTAASNEIPCDPRTHDLGVHYGWKNGYRTPYTMCAIPNLPSYNNIAPDILTDAMKTKYNIGTVAVMTSRVAGAMYSMVEAAKADGVTLVVNNSFRSFEWTAQKCYSTPGTLNLLPELKGHYDAVMEEGRNNDFVRRRGDSDPAHCTQSTTMFAPPGYSYHQSGTAVDFKTCSVSVSDPGPCLDRMYVWLVANANRFGFYQYRLEYWHYDPFLR